MKKLISLILALIMLISLAVPAFAEYFYDGDEIPEGNYDDIIIDRISRENSNTRAKVRINSTVTVNTDLYGNGGGAVIIGSNGLLQYNGADDTLLMQLSTDGIIIRIEEGGVLDVTFINDDTAEEFADFMSAFYCARCDGNRVVVKHSHSSAFTDDGFYCTVCGRRPKCRHGAWEEGVCFYCDYKCPHEYVFEDGKCAFCGYILDSSLCPHEIWSNGKCTQCGFVCQHDWSKRIWDVHIPKFCSICGYHCEHEVWEDEKCVNCGCECPHDEGWRKNICEICGYVCHHEVWKGKVCTKCGICCEHEAWKNGKCTNCGWECPHIWEGHNCIKCGQYCAHEVIENGKCVQCGCPCQHNAWEDGVCAACGYVCKHPGVGCIICGKGMYNRSAGSALSEGNMTIAVGIACAAVFGLGGYLLGKKKKEN